MDNRRTLAEADKRSMDWVRPSGRCTLRLQLDANLPVLRIRVEGENRAKDHRLRLRFNTELAGASTIADAAFHPVARAPLKLSDDEQRMEHVIASAPLHRWVARFTANAGATIFSDGLAEYESHDDGSVAVTLVRAVGALSPFRSARASGKRRLACGHTGCTITRAILGGVRCRASRR
jgi:mannosylglycerate hydrolase